MGMQLQNVDRVASQRLQVGKSAKEINILPTIDECATLPKSGESQQQRQQQQPQPQPQLQRNNNRLSDVSQPRLYPNTINMIQFPQNQIISQILYNQVPMNIATNPNQVPQNVNQFIYCSRIPRMEQSMNNISR